MLDLNTLKQALEPLSKVGRDEHTFEVGGINVTLRPLLPLEEVAVQRYTASVLDDIQSQEGLADADQMSRASMLDYFDRFRIEIIANAIVQVGDLDLRDVERIPTGEFLENGTPIVTSRTLAMREVVQGWSRAMITICFQRYGDLVQKIADKADKVAQTTLPDLDAEIERVEERLKRLKEDRETRAKGDPSVTTQQITSLLEAGKALEQKADLALDRAKAEAGLRRAEKEVEAIEKQEAAQASPEPEAAPPEPTPPPARKPVIPPASPPPGNQPVYQTTRAPVEPSTAPDTNSSFGDGADPEVLAAEEARILAARKAASMGAWQAGADGDGLSAAKPDGEVSGIPAYRMPSSNISPRGREDKATPEESAPASNINPHFKPSR